MIYALTAVLLVVISSGLGLQGASILATWIGFNIIVNKVSQKKPATAFGCLGFLTPLLAWSGSGVLVAMSLVTLASTNSLKTPRWLIPFLSLIAVWSLSLGLSEGLALYNSGVFEELGSAGRVLDSLSFAKPQFLVSIADLTRVLGFGLLCEHFASNREAREAFLRSLLWGGLIACLVLIVEGYFGERFIHLANDEFWSSISRYSGTFSDPNAAGVFLWCLLSVALIGPVRLSSVTKLTAVAVICLAALYAGSRTFFLGAALLAPVVLIHTGKLSFRSVLGVVLIAAVAAAVCMFSGLGAGVPIGISRLQESLDLSRLHDTFFSRNVFLRIGSAIWLDNPIVGVGPTGFSSLVTPYSIRLGIPIGTWTDNANNFYLQILCEYGILGALALLIGTVTLKFKGSRVELAVLFIFCILLLTGPHLNFDEVVLIFAGIIGGLLVTPSVVVAPGAIVAIISVPFILLAARRTEFGLYDWEKDGDSYFRWTAAVAKTNVYCDDSDGRAKFSIAQMFGRNLIVSSQAGDQKIPAKAGLNTPIAIECEPGVPVSVKIVTESPWRPVDKGLGSDKRLLGVKLILTPHT